MPRGDGTGPSGMGPMTGRSAGFCAGYSVPGYVNPVSGRGFGVGFGRGRAFGNWGRGRWPHYGAGYGLPYAMPFEAEAAPQQEIEALQVQAKSLENTLVQINQRITELEKEQVKK
ncbi:DUF5320 domain-containing protein [bacterium]